ncbi:MAG: hypothetical protein OHK0022_20520 [Roseiflexaceae bacterium]
MALATASSSETGVRQQSHLWLVGISILAGLVISTFWSAEFVDQQIGATIADTLLGDNARTMTISGVLIGLVYALVSGFAGAFTACNICAFSAIAPLAADKRSLGHVLKPILYLTIGMVTVSGVYGAIGALIGPALPQLSTVRLGDPNTGFQVRLIQSMVIFVGIGMIYIAWGLISLNLLRSPFASLNERYPWARSVFMGATIGAFLIGRPYGLFRHLFEYAASTHNPLVGMLAFVLQSLGNVVIMLVLFLALVYGTGGRFERWLHAEPDRVARLTGIALLIGGTFFCAYWGPRLLARNDMFFWPYWNWSTMELLFRAHR